MSGMPGRSGTPGWQSTYGVTEAGNFEGANVLSVPTASIDELPAWLADARRRLLAVRELRVHPGRDDKVLAGWNGLMIRAMAEAAGALDRPDYRDAAERAADALLVSLRRADGRLLRAVGSETPAFLEDYAALSLALLSLHGVTGSTRWLLEAVRLGEEALALFWDDEIAGFYDTGADAEQLIVRPRDLQDNAVPSGSALACEMLLRLAALTGRDEWRQKAERVLRGVMGVASEYPLGFGHLLTAARMALGPQLEVAVVGAADDPATVALLRAAHQAYAPDMVLAAGSPGNEGGSRRSLLAGREMIDGRPAAYVCRGGTCLPPVTTPSELSELLRARGA